jgi:short-subunit dehydrogenase
MFENQCWWITGASSGIGEGLARALAARGADLVLSGRNVAALEAVARDCPQALVLPFEATDFDRVPALVERAWSWKGRVHGLVNNAGISQRSLAVDTAFAVYQRMIAVDLLAPIALTQALLPRMVQAGGGRIVAMSSVAGIVGAPLRSAYSAAKHGLIGYHDAVRAENEHLGIQVHVLAPDRSGPNVSQPRNAPVADGSTRARSDAATAWAAATCSFA